MYQNAIRTIRTLLPLTSSVSRTEVEDAVNNILKIDRFSGLNKESLIRQIEEVYRIRQDDFKKIERSERRLPWLREKKTSIPWRFWNRYREYLEFEKNFSLEVVNKLDNLTDDILDSLFDPNRKIEIDKKGLVVGQVQSGKTANYTGLICKAADSGFKIIIVLAGIHNNLRSQTQLRLDEGFLGRHTKEITNNDSNVIGVGLIDGLISAHSLTTSLENGDFTSNSSNVHGLDFNTGDTIIAVIKKNPHVLRRINNWLTTQGRANDTGRISNKSLLLIDDEADNASINISNDPEKRSTINDLITQLLTRFRKSAYVGYTATPFANIFIPLEEDNLFPRDFIINIPAPSNYIGPDKIFGFNLVEDEQESDVVLPIINRINDYDTFVPNRHKKDDQLPTKLPDSLKRSIRCFMLTCSIRRLRGQTDVHNSMLVHVSRFVRWQDFIAELIENKFNYYRRGIDQNDPTIIEEFRNTFETDEIGYKSYVTVSGQILNSELATIDSQVQIHTWKDVLFHLNDAASRIKVKAIHGGSGEALDYYGHKNGLSVIVVGGNKLSRGLTLEGLSVSYYLRASRMYDTLMQMGRWFGYRAGYVDLCRLFTSRELNEWFCHITNASEELREEFDYMSKDSGSTPDQYALKVRTLPGILLVSAINKMRQAVNFDLSYSEKLVQTNILYCKQEEVEYNFKVINSFLNKIESSPRSDNEKIVFKNVSPNLIMDELISQYKFHPNLKAINPSLIKQYIRNCNLNGELIEWTVALFKTQSKDAKQFKLTIDNKIDEHIGMTIRNPKQGTSSMEDNTYIPRNSNILSPPHQYIDISSLPEKPTGKIIRGIRDPRTALLMIYPLDPRVIGGNYSTPIFGFALSFPRSPSNVSVKYAAHQQLVQYLDWEEDDEDNEENED
jgi:hypothetical protein